MATFKLKKKHTRLDIILNVEWEIKIFKKKNKTEINISEIYTNIITNMLKFPSNEEQI